MERILSVGKKRRREYCQPASEKSRRKYCWPIREEKPFKMSPACKEITYRKNEKSGNLSLDDDKTDGETSCILDFIAVFFSSSFCSAKI